MSARRPALLALLAVLALVGLIHPSMAAASTVANPTFQTESSATGATALVDEVGFQTTTALSESGDDSVTIEAPSGVVLDANPDDTAINFIDATANNSQYVSNATNPDGGSTITIPVPFDVPAGHQVYVELGNTSNPTTDGSGNWTVSTSQDTTPAMAGSQSFLPSSVSNFSATASPASANSTASYTVNFTLANQLRVDDFQGQSLFETSDITFTAPSGVNFNATCPNAQLTDDTTHVRQTLYCNSISGGNQISFNVGTADIAAGDSVSIEIDDVTNPPNAGDQGVSVSTTSDPTAADNDVDITPDTAVTDTSLQTESSAVNATQLVDEVGFVATTALSQSGESSITINAPSGVQLNSTYTDLGVYDVTTGTSVQGASASLSNSSSSINITVPFDIAAGDHVYVELEQVTNPSSPGSGQWSVNTSSDLMQVNAGSPQTFADISVSGFSISISSTAANATGVTYTAQFTTASQLRAYDWQNTQMDSGEVSQIVFTAPSSASFPNGCQSAQLTDFTHPADDQTLSCNATSGNQITYNVQDANIPAGDDVSVAIGGVTNPSSSVAGQSVSLYTTSDPDSVSATVPSVIISEFRLTSDPYIDLANISSSSVSVSGWTLELADTSGDSTSIPLSGTIAPYGHLLVADSSYASDPLASLAAADITHSFGSVLDDGGARLLDNNSNLMDAVGFGAAPAGYFSGAPLTLPATLPSGVEFAWTRNYSAGAPTDTGDNASDFTYIAESDAGNSTYGSPVLGTPGPLDSGGAVGHNDVLQSTLLDPGVGQTTSPNRIYTAGSPGTLLINRTLFNCTGQAISASCPNSAQGTTAANVTRLQFRVTALTTQGSPGSSSSQAVLVPEPSSGGSIDGYTVQGMNLAGGASTGGLNSVWTTNVSSGNPIAPGSSINVQFAFKVEQPGNFSFGYNAEDDLDPVNGGSSSSGGSSTSAGAPGPTETIVSGTITRTGKVIITSVRKGQRAALCTAGKRKGKKHGKKRPPRCVLAHIAARPHKRHRALKKSTRTNIAASRDAADLRRE